MLSSTMTVQEENEESLLSDLAFITDCTGTGHWVHFCGQREMAHCVVNTDIVDADVLFLPLMQDALNDKLLNITYIHATNINGFYLLYTFFAATLLHSKLLGQLQS